MYGEKEERATLTLLLNLDLAYKSMIINSMAPRITTAIFKPEDAPDVKNGRNFSLRG